MAHLSSQDLDLLSAYLDGQVSARERAAVEKRLQTDPQARQALDELRQLRALLRALPPRRLPHAFTLTRAMAQAQRLPRAIPVLRFSSLFSALAMIFLLVLQVGPRMLPTALAPVPALESFSADQATAAPVILWNQPGGGGGGAPVGMGGVDAYSAEAPAEAVAKEVDPQAAPADTALSQATSVPEELRVLPTATPAALPAVADEAQPPAILGLNTAEAGSMTSQAVPTGGREARQPLGALAWAQIGLGAAALGCGLAAFILTRRFRRG